MTGNPHKPPDGYFYILRLRIEHPSLTEDEINCSIGLEPDYFLQYQHHGKPRIRWGFSEWTKDVGEFFSEIKYCLHWLKKKRKFIEQLNSTGGALTVVISLPGRINMKDTISAEILRDSLDIGVAVAVEVYPRLELQTRK